METIFLDSLTQRAIPGALSKLSKFDIKALVFLHELKHVYSGPAPEAHDPQGGGGWNDEISKKCF